jgi:hypothetical protein
MDFVNKHIGKDYTTGRYKEDFSIANLPVIWTAMTRADSGDHFVIDYLEDLAEKLSKSG